MSANLPSLRTGDVGRISAVRSNDASAKRLADLGFVRGAELEMLHPGNPCIVRIDSAFLGLGAGHQANIELSFD